MLRRLFVMPLCLLLVACGPPAAPPTPTPAARATQVAQLTQVAAAVQASVEARQATQTARSLPAATATPPPASTPAPTGTPLPRGSATPTTRPPTPTVRPPTAAPPPPTLEPGVVITRQLPFLDDFANPASGWPTRDLDWGGYDYVPGGYRYHLEQLHYKNRIRNKRFRGGDVRVAVTATFQTGETGLNGIGVICRLQDNLEDYYAFTLFASGDFQIDMVRGLSPRPLVYSPAQSWLPKAVLTTGAPHRIEAECAGETLSLRVDGVLLAQAWDDSYATGQVGLLACTCGGVPLNVLLNDFAVNAPGPVLRVAPARAPASASALAPDRRPPAYEARTRRVSV